MSEKAAGLMWHQGLTTTIIGNESIPYQPLALNPNNLQCLSLVISQKSYSQEAISPSIPAYNRIFFTIYLKRQGDLHTYVKSQITYIQSYGFLRKTKE